MDHLPWHRAVISGFSIFAVALSLAAAAQDVAPKVAIPTPDRQAQIRKLLDETFELSRATTAVKKQQAARKLMEMAGNSATTPDELYVVLVSAFPLLRESGDFPTYLKAVDQLISSFQVDAPAEQKKYLIDFVVSCKSATVLEPVLVELAAIVSRKANENDFRTAHELLDAAERQAKKIGATTIAKSLTEVRGALRIREQAFNAQIQGRRTLAAKPDDAKANLAVGFWLAVYESDWEQAIPMLTLGSDAKWKVAAMAEPKSSAEVEAQIAAADAWWDIAQAETGNAKVAAQSRARGWYERYEPNAKSPLVKARVAKRLEELEASLTPSTTGAGITSAEPANSNKDEGLPIGKWVDLLAMVRLPDHCCRGQWQRRNDGLVGEASDSVLMLPIAVRGGYELTFRFVTESDGKTVKFMFPVGSSSCGLVLNAGNVSGLEMLDGKAVRSLDPSTGAVLRPGPLPGGNHQLQIELSQVNERVTIEARLDGHKLISWQGQITQLSQFPDHVIPCPQAIGILIGSAPVDFRKIEIRLKRGAKAYRLGDDWKNPVTQVSTAPSKEVAAECVVWKGRKYLFSNNSMPLSEAQRMAVQVQGRLLTISSAEEEAFIMEQGRGRTFWMSGWRRADNKE